MIKQHLGSIVLAAAIILASIIYALSTRYEIVPVPREGDAYTVCVKATHLARERVMAA